MEMFTGAPLVHGASGWEGSVKLAYLEDVVMMFAELRMGRAPQPYEHEPNLGEAAGKAYKTSVSEEEVVAVQVAFDVLARPAPPVMGVLTPHDMMRIRSDFNQPLIKFKNDSPANQMNKKQFVETWQWLCEQAGEEVPKKSVLEKVFKNNDDDKSGNMDFDEFVTL